MDIANPLLGDWIHDTGMPPFGAVRVHHLAPAFAAAQAEQLGELAAIVANPAAADFENTIAAFDRSGYRLERLDFLFNTVSMTVTSSEIQAVERELAPREAAHANAIFLDAALFARIDAVHAQRESPGLDEEQRRLVERLHLDFVRAGARLSGADRARYAALREELAELRTQFGQNVMADENAFELRLGPSDLDGLPLPLRATLREAGRARGRDGYVVTLSRSLVVPFLSFSARRDLREQAWRGWVGRGSNAGATDNRQVLARILELRREQARLHGKASYAEHALTDTMAGTPAAALALLRKVWEPACARAAREADELQAMIDADGDDFELAPWDWRYYAERVRALRYELSDSETRPYFELPRMVAAMFDCAGRLFGLDFVARDDLAAWHPDVRVYEVVDRASGNAIGLFAQDNFARPFKRGGAWMSALRWQTRNLADGAADLPIITNNNNFAKGAQGQPTLLGIDDLRTLFHEFGHGLHGLLSQVRYRRLSGTQVLRDFVELPSQLFEHWIAEPQVLKRHAIHVETGEPIPDELLARIAAASRFNQGFESVEYTASALVDLAAHSLGNYAGFDPEAFEREQLDAIGMPAAIVMRHRLPHFQHLFEGDGYAAGYYVYLWAEVLDCDAWDAFVEKGDPFDQETATRLRKFIYSSGGSRNPAEAFRAFRGRDAVVGPMLAERGLLVESR